MQQGGRWGNLNVVDRCHNGRHERLQGAVRQDQAALRWGRVTRQDEATRWGKRTRQGKGTRQDKRPRWGRVRGTRQSEGTMQGDKVTQQGAAR